MASISNKLVAVGDAGCGKTSLFNVFLTGNALDGNTPHKFKKEVIDVVFDTKTVELSLCSTAGKNMEVRTGFIVDIRSEIYLCSSFFSGAEDLTEDLRKVTYQNTAVFLMCFSIDNPDSLVNIEKKWWPEICQVCPKGTTIQSIAI